MILKRVKTLEEARESKEKYNDLYSEIRSLDPKFNDVSDAALYQILGICLRENSEQFKHKTDITAQDVLDFINDSGSIGEFIDWFKENLSVETISSLGKIDPKFVKACKKYAYKAGYIDSDGRDVSFPEKAPLSFVELIYALLLDSCVNKTEQVEQIDAIMHVYRNLNEAFVEVKKEEPIVFQEDEITEAKESEPAEEDSDNEPSEEESNTEQPVEQVTIEEPSEKIQDVELDTTLDVIPTEDVMPENTLNDLLNPIQNLINIQWNNIAEVKNLITQIDETYKGNNKEEAISVLNQMLDDYTINVGMLHKVIQLTNPLINSGAEKADEIITK